MLGINSIQDLAERLRTTPRRIFHLADHFSGFVRHYELVDPLNPDKPPRAVIGTFGDLRRILDRLLRYVLLPVLRPSPFNYGGVRGRNIRTNALAHAGSIFAWNTDISSFFPSIHQNTVRDLFAGRLGCSGRVAGLLTRLCTYEHHLAVGLPTSPLLADQIAKRFDVRIAGLADQHGLVYTRFVDDVTLSGPFSLDPRQCRLSRLVERILEECGFSISATKTIWGRLDNKEMLITKLRFHHGRLDVASNYAREVERQITDHHSLAIGGPFAGPLLMRDMLRSRIQFICSIRRSRRRQLIRRFGSIDWQNVIWRAEERGLVVVRKILRPVSAGSLNRHKFKAQVSNLAEETGGTSELSGL